MASKTEIANLAIGHLGYTKFIANIETEQSKEAKAANRFYDMARQAVLRDFHWDFAKIYKSLGLIAENPTDEWRYSYEYPTDCLMIRRVMSGIRNSPQDRKIPYQLSYGASDTVIYMDIQTPCLEYTKDVTDGARFPPDFILSLSRRLSVYLTPHLTRGDQFKIGTNMMNLYVQELGVARSNSANEFQKDEDPDAEYIRARGSANRFLRNRP
jgi:hypothetical protein